jgi:hypothetical protein
LGLGTERIKDIYPGGNHFMILCGVNTIFKKVPIGIETGILLVHQLMGSLCKHFPGLLLEA